jgi:hypothetical protein
MRGQRDLSHIVQTGCATSCFSHLLDCWQQHRDQNPNDRNDYQQFNESKTHVSAHVIFS